MKDTNRNRVIILSITEGSLTATKAATRFNVSKRWVYTLLARYRTGGLDAVDPQSKRPHTNPNATDQTTITTILNLRTTLIKQGLDAGPESIWDRLPVQTRPSTATIWRILRRNNTITDQPQKRPRSSWHRFEAAAPNETWQSDFTHWPFADATGIKIISWLDDHSRMLLQTLKRWLRADGLVDTSEALNEQLARFTHIYNTRRPHRAIGRRTPESVYADSIKAAPVIEIDHTTWRVRYDQIDATGKISIRYAGRLRHLGIGRAWARVRVLLLMHGPNTLVIDRTAGEIIAEHTIDPEKNYQKKK